MFATIRTVALSAAAAAMLVPAIATAATDGRLGTTSSTGEVAISARVLALVQLSDLDDIDLGDFSGSDLQAADELCVYSNAGQYRVTATGNGGNGGKEFALAGKNLKQDLPYAITWSHGGAATRLTSGTTVTVKTSAVTGADCTFGGGKNNAGIQVDISAADAQNASQDTYAGVLNITVAPN